MAERLSGPAEKADQNDLFSLYTTQKIKLKNLVILLSILKFAIQVMMMGCGEMVLTPFLANYWIINPYHVLNH